MFTLAALTPLVATMTGSAAISEVKRQVVGGGTGVSPPQLELAEIQK